MSHLYNTQRDGCQKVTAKQVQSQLQINFVHKEFSKISFKLNGALNLIHLCVFHYY
jgi:hypothetical protein